MDQIKAADDGESTGVSMGINIFVKKYPQCNISDCKYHSLLNVYLFDVVVWL